MYNVSATISAIYVVNSYPVNWILINSFANYHYVIKVDTADTKARDLV
jgi:hypothetical protein